MSDELFEVNGDDERDLVNDVIVNEEDLSCIDDRVCNGLGNCNLADPMCNNCDSISDCREFDNLRSEGFISSLEE